MNDTYHIGIVGAAAVFRKLRQYMEVRS